MSILAYAVVDDEHGPQAVFETKAEALRFARQHRPGCAHCRSLAEYRAARRAWESAREREALGYATEERMYAEAHGTITYKAWLTGMAVSA